MEQFSIIDLKGGIGNQLFQYAFGRALQHKLGIKIYYNDEYYKKQKKNSHRWNSDGIYYSENTLSIFNLPIQYADTSKLEYIYEYNKDNYSSFWVKFLRSIMRKAKIIDGKMIENRAQRYYSNFFDKYSFINYTGYYQNEKYFKFIENKLRKEFIFPEFELDDTYNRSIVKKITACTNPVFLHVRRGDYVKIGCNISDTDYYKKACSYIKKIIPDASFFVFSDDMDYIKNNFDIGYNFIIIGTENFDNYQDYKDMQLMTYFKHAIIANSTFSWWGAWLINNKNKIVIAPKPWFPNSNSPEIVNQIICDNWIGIDY